MCVPNLHPSTTIFLLQFGTVPTVWYLFFYHTVPTVWYLFVWFSFLYFYHIYKLHLYGIARRCPRFKRFYLKPTTWLCIFKGTYIYIFVDQSFQFMIEVCCKQTIIRRYRKFPFSEKQCMLEEGTLSKVKVSIWL